MDQVENPENPSAALAEEFATHSASYDVRNGIIDECLEGEQEKPQPQKKQAKKNRTAAEKAAAKATVEAEAEATAEEGTSAHAEEQEVHNPEEMPRAERRLTILQKCARRRLTILQEQVRLPASVTSAAASTVRRNIRKTVLSTAVKIPVTAANRSILALQKNGRCIQGQRQTCHRYLAKQRGLMHMNSSKGCTKYRSRPAHNGWRQQRRTH